MEFITNENLNRPELQEIVRLVLLQTIEHAVLETSMVTGRNSVQSDVYSVAIEYLAYLNNINYLDSPEHINNSIETLREICEFLCKYPSLRIVIASYLKAGMTYNDFYDLFSFISQISFKHPELEQILLAINKQGDKLTIEDHRLLLNYCLALLDNNRANLNTNIINSFVTFKQDDHYEEAKSLIRDLTKILRENKTPDNLPSLAFFVNCQCQFPENTQYLIQTILKYPERLGRLEFIQGFLSVLGRVPTELESIIVQRLSEAKEQDYEAYRESLNDFAIELQARSINNKILSHRFNIINLILFSPRSAHAIFDIFYNVGIIISFNDNDQVQSDKLVKGTGHILSKLISIIIQANQQANGGVISLEPVANKSTIDTNTLNLSIVDLSQYISLGEQAGFFFYKLKYNN